MAGYTRQATANIVTGAVIDAADFNSEYNAIEAAFNATTGHTHDGSTGNGPPIENLGPSQDLVVTSSVVRAKTDNTYDLGTSSIEWKDGFFDGTLRTDILTVDETSTLTGNVTASADVSVGGNLTVTGNATINGNLTFGDADTDSVAFGADITSSLIPDGSTQDLGSSTKQRRNLYIDGTANIDALVADTADINGGSIDGTIIGANATAAITGTTITGTSLVGPLTGNASGSAGSCTGNSATATKLATTRAIALSGAVTGTANFDGSAGITISTTAASDPSLTLQGDVTGSATFTNLGNATLTASLAANSVGTSEIATNGVGTTEIAADAVTSAKIAAGAVDSTALATDAVTTAKIADNAITAALIAANAVGASEIAANAVGSSEIATNAVGSDEIAANAVGASEIAASAVGASELNVSGNGTTSEFLRSDGDGTFTWATPAGQTLTGGTSISISGSAINLDADSRFGNAVDVKVGNDHEYIRFNPSSNGQINFHNNNGTENMRLFGGGGLQVKDNITAFSTTVSDQRLKHDIEKIEGALDKVTKLSGYTFSYNKDSKKSAGVLAQEVEKVLPSAVENKSLVFHGEENVEYKTVQYDQLHGLLIEAIKELKEQLDECKCKKCECE